jgi:carboxylesterase type B
MGGSPAVRSGTARVRRPFSRFARDGVVCVTINYRVGADLTWVQENIAAFGDQTT